MSTLQAMPDKWAVRIKSIQDAELLKELFPEYDCAEGENDYRTRVKGLGKSARLCYCYNAETKRFGFDHLSYFKQRGYTIYTLSQLKELLK